MLALTVTRPLGDVMPTDAERLEHEMRRAVRHGRVLKERRLDLGLKRPAFVSEVARHGQEMTPDYLNKLESGARALANASPELREAIRAVLGYSPEKWQELTGLYIPGINPSDSNNAPASVAQTAPTSDPPSLPPDQERRPLPDGLVEAIQKYGHIAPNLHLDDWQQFLAKFRPRGEEKDADDWYDFYRNLVKFDIKPGDPN